MTTLTRITVDLQSGAFVEADFYRDDDGIARIAHIAIHGENIQAADLRSVPLSLLHGRYNAGWHR